MKKVFRWVFNKYTITAALFAAWMMFFDQNDLVTQKHTRQQLQETKDNIKYLSSQTELMKSEYEQLIADTQRLEQYARESYRMKRDNEDLYVIERQ